MGNHGEPWGTVGDRGNQLEPAGTLESQPGVLDDGMQNSALGCMISRLYQCFSFVAREFRPCNDLTPTSAVKGQSVSGGRLDTLSQQQDKLNLRLLSLGN